MNLTLGSTGNDVKDLQKMLNSMGYTLTVDGIFGEKTSSAVKDYQKKNGLTVDGIVGSQTWGSLQKTSATSSTATAAPTISPAPTAPTFNNTNYDDTEEGKSAKDKMNTASDAVANYGDFTYSKSGEYDAVIDKILNRKDFSYDLNGDALYQQYKDQYIKQGKLAMQDTMGQAAAMTGGYGNSYAQSVGQQAYNAQLDKLNDIVPELWQMAYNKYKGDEESLYNQYGMLSDDRNTEYGVWTDGYNRLVGERDYASDSYYNALNAYNTDRDTANNLSQTEYQNAYNEWLANSDNAWKTAEWDKDARRWEKEYDLKDRQVSLSEDEFEEKKNSVATSNSSSGTTYGPSQTYEKTIDAGDGKKTTNEKGTTYKSVNTENMQLFKAAIKTKNEFYTRGGSDKETYKTYEGYIEGILDKWLSQGKLNEDEVASLLIYYGLA